MLKRHLLLSFLFIAAVSNAQVTSTSWWTWMNGDSTTNKTGVYNTQGTPSAANKPGARRYSISWKDNAGNLWFFGGQGYATTGGTGFLNDLWKYDPSTNVWTWMSGDNSAGIAPVYGTQGVASSTNKPGGRYSSVSWTDPTGTLWLFGGYGYASNGLGYLNDLWSYNPSTNEWTWVKGDNVTNTYSVYGTQSTASATNKPGSRYGSQSWTDAGGNLWLFGGYGYAPGGSNDLNDLWKFNTATKEWTWMKGDNTVNSLGVYGSKTIANATNNPGARRQSTGWMDNTGNIFLFGGYGFAASGSVNFLNDLWKYNTTTNQWTWLHGDSTANIAGEYGAQGTAAAPNKPGSRYLGTSWKDAAGNAWLFGGYGFAAGDGGYLSDMWKYDVASNEWTWIKGDNNSNNYGLYGSTASTTSYLPGARQSLISWTDNQDNLWIFGGHGYVTSGNAGYLNDMWKFGGTSSVLALAITSVRAYTKGNDIEVEWLVKNEAGVDRYEVEKSANGVDFIKAGIENPKALNPGKTTYKWIDQAPFSTNNFYRIKTVDNTGNIKYSEVIHVTSGSGVKGISIYPTPILNNTFHVRLSNQPKGKYQVQLYNSAGQQVYSNSIMHQGGSAVHSLQLNNSSSKGIFFLQVSNGEGIVLRTATSIL